MYTNKSNHFVAKFAANKGSIIDLTSAAVADLSYLCIRQCDVKRLAVVVTTATVSNVNIVVTFRKRPTPGSSVGQSTVGTVVIPAGATVGQVYYKDLASAAATLLPPGTELAIEVTTQAGGGGAAGQGQAVYVADDDPETASNVTAMVASA